MGNMLRCLKFLVLSISVAFIGFYLHDYEPVRSVMRDNTKVYLTKMGVERWMECFDCCYQALVYILMLTPLVLVDKKFKIAALLSSGVIKIIGALQYFDINDIKGSLLNEEMMKYYVISCGLFLMCCPNKDAKKVTQNKK